MNTICVGADVSKGYADIEFRNSAGTFLKEAGRFDDTAEGHGELAERMAELARKNADVRFIVGLEATGGLERNWDKFFRMLKNEFDLELLILNPFVVKKHLERNLRRNINDKISAKNIADYLAIGRRLQDVDYEPQMQGARSLYRCITAATGRRVQAQCELQSLLPSVQPELVQYCRDGMPDWILDLLLVYPTASRLAKARVTTVAKIKQISVERATKLIAAAKESVASLSDHYTEEAILFLAKEIREQNEKHSHLQKMLINSLKKDQDVQIIDSISGIGTWTGVILRLEYGNMERFHSAEAAVAYAGLDPRINQSGDSERHLGISRAGRIRIRAALYMPTLAAIRFNPIIRDFYNRLIAAGKPEKLVILACMRKLIHIIYATCVTGKFFDPDYQQKHATALAAKSANTESLPATAETPQTSSLAAPISRKEAKKRKAAAMPQKDNRPLMRGPGAANKNNKQNGL